MATAIVPASITLSWRPIMRPMTASRARDDSSENDERKDMIEPCEPADATEKVEAMAPIEPRDAMDPTEPTDRIDPRDAIESMESSDHRDHRDVIGVPPERDCVASPTQPRRQRPGPL